MVYENTDPEIGIPVNNLSLFEHLTSSWDMFGRDKVTIWKNEDELHKLFTELAKKK
tara:strand:+ start:830 stop:997 length:168 start_codon:yes stop_codon:yes gene_type:complete